MTPPKHKSPWTEADENYLASAWGHAPPDTIARKLGRSLGAIRFRVWWLHLNGRNGFLSLTEVSRRTGYFPSSLKVLAKRCGITLRRFPCARKNRGRKGRHYAITEEQYEQLVEAIKQLKAPKKISLTSAGEWGSGGKPEMCRCCSRTDRPYRGRGLCTACHHRLWRNKALESYPPIKGK